MLRRLTSLSPTERRVLVQATAQITATRFWLSVQPLGRVMARARRRADRPLKRPAAPVPTLVWGVRAAGRRLLRKNPCLTEAIVLWALLRRHGYDSQIRIGVARDRPAEFEAHAWVERNGEVLIGGGHAPGAYVPLPVFDVQ